MRFQFVRRLEDDALFLNSERKERFLLRRQKSSPRPKTRRKKQKREEERMNAGLFLKRRKTYRCGVAGQPVAASIVVARFHRRPLFQFI